MQRKPTTAFVYLLGSYVLVQFIWWGYHLIDLTQASAKNPDLVSKRVLMIVGEGSVFLLLLLFGLWKIKTSIRKEIDMAKQQNNFMLSVTHELKTPIAANKLYLQTLQKHSQLSEEKKQELMLKAIDETNRLESLVEQILTASRLEQRSVDLHKDRFLLAAFLADLIEIQQKRLSQTIQVNPFKDVEIFTDRLLFATILNNLIENAHKYGHSEKGIEIHISTNELYLSIKVLDHGKGIPLDKQRLLFKKFTRLENEETRSTKGTGLGLYIAYQCTKALGGELKIIHQEQPGATFEIQLPYE
jgi:signal transduction histidine kinase